VLIFRIKNLFINKFDCLLSMQRRPTVHDVVHASTAALFYLPFMPHHLLGLFYFSENDRTFLSATESYFKLLKNDCIFKGFFSETVVVCQ